MQVRILASGSKGNAVFVEMDGTKLLLDAGISATKIKKGLATYRIVSDNRFNQEDETKKDKELEHKRQTIVLKIHDLDLKSTIHIY